MKKVTSGWHLFSFQLQQGGPPTPLPDYQSNRKSYRTDRTKIDSDCFRLGFESAVFLFFQTFFGPFSNSVRAAFSSFLNAFAELKFFLILQIWKSIFAEERILICVTLHQYFQTLVSTSLLKKDRGLKTLHKELEHVSHFLKTWPSSHFPVYCCRI